MYQRPYNGGVTPMGEQQRYHSNGGGDTPLGSGMGGGMGMGSGFTSPMPANGMGAPVAGYYGNGSANGFSSSAPISSYPVPVARYGSGTPNTGASLVPGANRYIRAATTYGAPPPPLPTAQVLAYQPYFTCIVHASHKRLTLRVV